MTRLFEVILLLLFFSALSLSQEIKLSDPIVSIIDEDSISIRFRLPGDNETLYKVRFFLVSEMNEEKEISDDIIGERNDLSPGGYDYKWKIDTTIVYVDEQFSIKIQASGYSKQGVPWYYYAGVPVIVGGYAILYSSKETKSNSTPTIQEKYIPIPPGRP